MKYDPEILISLYLNNNEEMTDEHIQSLQEWVNASTDHTRQFVRASCIHRLVHDHLTGNDRQKRLMAPSGQRQPDYLPEDGYCEAAFWDALSQHEKDAKTLIIPLAQQPKELITNVRQRKATLKPERKRIPVGLWISLGSLAALFVMIVYIMQNPRIAQTVATLTDSYEAHWQFKPLEVGDRLTNAQYPLKLISGYAKLQLDNGAEVIIEGPSEFRLINAEQMRVMQGKITANVPPAASGFRVDTPAMSVIDLGTEFSVKIEKGGLSAVHLYKGKASLQIGEVGKRKNSHILTQGQARRVDPDTGRIETIPIEQHGFVRRLDSKKGLLWHGDPIDLADVVAGGDGFSNIHGIFGINPKTGKNVNEYKYTEYFSTGDYVSVPENPYVDGVFIPDGEIGLNIISSRGHVFEECPDTAGVSDNPIGATSHDILTFRNYDDGMIPESRRNKLPVFNEKVMGTAQHPVVLMHSNVGITFDLQAMRSHNIDFEITQFVSSLGMSSLLKDTPQTDVWILIDGQMRFSRQELTPVTGVLDIIIDLAPEDRFLTIIVTDAAYANTSKEGAYSNDYVYLINPRLTLMGK